MERPEQLPQRLYRNSQRRPSRGRSVDRASEGYVNNSVRGQQQRYDDDASTLCDTDSRYQASDYTEGVLRGQYISHNLCIASGMSAEGLTLH